MRIHSGEKPFVCSHCQKSFRQRSQMRSHVKAMHTNPKKKPKTPKAFANAQRCDQCPKVFINKEKLDLHIKVHHLNQRPFKCDMCDKSFCTKGSLRLHVEKGKHDPFTKKQKCTCPVCFKVFPEASKLESHIAEDHIEIPLVRLVESDGREILGVNVKNIPGLEKTLKAAEHDVKQEVLSETGDIPADGEITLGSDSDITDITRLTQANDLVVVQRVEDNEVITTTTENVTMSDSIVTTDSPTETVVTQSGAVVPDKVIVVTSAAVV